MRFKEYLMTKNKQTLFGTFADNAFRQMAK